MKMEITRLEPLRTANVLAILYGVIMVVAMLIAVPIVFLAFALGGGGGPESFIVLIMLFAYPVIGVVFGWLGGLLIGFIYNIVVGITGGLLIDTRDLSPVSDPTNIPPAA